MNTLYTAHLATKEFYNPQPRTPNTIASKEFEYYAITRKYHKDPNRISLEGTVPTGLEKIALIEINEKFNITNPAFDTATTQGHVYFTINTEDYHKVKELRSVDNVNLVTLYEPRIGFFEGDEEFILLNFEKIKMLSHSHDLIDGVRTWAQLVNYKGKLLPSKAEHDAAKKIRDEERSLPVGERTDLGILRFRITCHRSLEHNFTSTEFQHAYGGMVNDNYHWLVALDDYDVLIYVKLHGRYLLVSLKLTQNSLHNRCLVEFGPTSLRPTIAYNMLQICGIQTGNIVVDPLCGGGSIPIEAAYGFPNCVVMCGDIHELAVERSSKNIAAIKEGLQKPNVFHWDSVKLPFQDNSIDVICTDLPFGKRCCVDVRTLYRTVVKEFARVTKKDGRICLLVHKAHNIIGTLTSKLYVDRKITVNVGGLKCTVFLLRHHQVKLF